MTKKLASSKKGKGRKSVAKETIADPAENFDFMLDAALEELIEKLEEPEAYVNDFTSQVDGLNGALQALVNLSALLPEKSKSKKAVSFEDEEESDELWSAVEKYSSDRVLDRLQVDFKKLLKDVREEEIIDEDDFEEFVEDLDSEEEELEEEVSEGSDEFGGNDELKALMEPVEDDSEFEGFSDEEEEGNNEEEDQDDDNEDALDREMSRRFQENPQGRALFDKDDDEINKDEINLSSFEKAQKALRAQINSLEHENVDTEKPWNLRGEITARQRPQDSLLEELVEFDHLSRPVPQITEETTEEIEDIIMRRVREQAWDDVERKQAKDLTIVAGLHNAAQTKKMLESIADSAEAKKSLNQVYEEEFEAKMEGGEGKVDAETKAKQQVLSDLFAKVCRHLDGLSGNKFAPKVYAQSEIQIKTLGKK